MRSFRVSKFIWAIFLLLSTCWTLPKNTTGCRFTRRLSELTLAHSTCWGPTCEPCSQQQRRAPNLSGSELSGWSDTRPAQRLLCGSWCRHRRRLKPPAPRSCEEKAEEEKTIFKGSGGGGDDSNRNAEISRVQLKAWPATNDFIQRETYVNVRTHLAVSRMSQTLI